jgi:uncharacterized protein
MSTISRPTATFWGLLALSLSILLSSFILGGAAVRFRRAGDAITVTGSAKRPIRSDFVVWRGTVAAQQSSLATASTELERYVTRTRELLRTKGIADSLITWRAIESQPVQDFREGGGRIVGYRLAQTFEIRSPDVDGITRLAQEASEVIREGVPLQPMPPEYLYTKLSDIRAEMLTAATRDAKTRADAIAASTGNDVGPVREARMGVFQITPRNSTEVSDYGFNDTSAIEKDITAVVRVTFAMD